MPDPTDTETPAIDREALAAALLDVADAMADITRKERSIESPCRHWIGQALAVCSPCLWDRLAAELLDLVAPEVSR